MGLVGQEHSLLGEPNKSNIKVITPKKQRPRLTFAVHITHTPHVCTCVYMHTHTDVVE